MNIPVQQPFQPNSPSLSPSRKNTSSALNPKSMLPAKDSVHFGMQYFQTRGATASRDPNNPVFRNNCMVNSVKNLLAYYGYNNDIIENIVHKDFQVEILNQNYFIRDSPTYTDVHTNEIELNETFVRQYLSDPNKGLGMALKAHNIQEVDSLEEAIDQRKPILVFGRAGAHTLAVDDVSADEGRHHLSCDHAYVVVPSSNQGEWLVQDPWDNKETRLTAQQLKHNLRSLAHDRDNDLASIYNVVEGEPNADLMNVFASTQSNSTHREPSSTATSPKSISKKPPVNHKPTTSESIENANPSPIIRLKNWLRQKWDGLTCAISEAWQKFKTWFTGCCRKFPFLF